MMFVYIYGIISTRENLFPANRAIELYTRFIPPNFEKLDYTDTSAKTEVTCESLKKKKLMVILSLGQSNAANTGDTKFASRNGVYNYYKGKCYIAADPLLGATGGMGNITTRLGQKIVDKKLYGNVIISTAAIAAVPINTFLPGQIYHHRVIDAIKDLKARNLAVTHILWTQGESDITTSETDYRNRFLAVLKSIREQGVDAPVYVAISTRRNNRVNVQIQSAQKKLPDPSLGIFPGPNADDLLNHSDDRHDGIHFSASGMDKYASMWMDSLFKPSH